MPNYYNKTTFERKDIAQDLIDLWTETSNPKLGEYELTPPAPSPDAVWDNGQWVIPPAPTYTAEQWLSKEGYGATQLVTLLNLEAQLAAAAKTSPALTAVKAWTNNLLAAFVADPAPRADWPPAPHTFAATVTEAYALL